MTEHASTNDILARIRAGEERAATDLFDGYLKRLTALVRVRIADRLASRFDPEDVVLSAFRSFFVANRDGRIDAEDSHDLWRVLVAFTLRKLSRHVERHTAEKRSVGHDVRLSVVELFDQEPKAEHVILIADEVEQLYRTLNDRDREIVELRLNGYEQQEIAEIVNVSERTVRRILTKLRQRYGESDLPLETVQTHAQLIPEITLPGTLPTINISDLRIETMLGAGGMGRVYRARQFSEQRFVAVKFLRKRLLSDLQFVQRFFREAETLRKVNASGIVKCLGIGQVSNRGLFIVMELINGNSLGQYCSEQNPSVNEALEWCQQAAIAIHQAHSVGVIHCDLKPDNLLLGNDGKISVADFGLATNVDDPRLNGRQFGTAPYMAPEQISSEWGDITERTDVYGLAAVLYTLLTGQPPYLGRTIPEILSQVVSPVAPPVVNSFQSSTPQAVSDLCMRSLAKNPLERLSSMHEFAESLAVFLNQ